MNGERIKMTVKDRYINEKPYAVKFDGVGLQILLYKPKPPESENPYCDFVSAICLNGKIEQVRSCKVSTAGHTSPHIRKLGQRQYLSDFVRIL